MGEPLLNLSPVISDEIRKTTCYMCACRCGVDVYIKDGRVRYLQGNRDHPTNRGVLCAKGSAGMLHQESPARLHGPLLRTGPRGSGQFKEISWEEALTIATDWLGNVRKYDPKKLAFFTGRDQNQSFTGWWAQQYGTPNHAAHGGFCSVNMAAGGIYSIGGSFWEFAQPDWKQAKLLLMFGVAEDHESNPIKLGLSKMRKNGARIVSINPIRTGYSALADTWLGITPGTDGLLIYSLIGELLRSGQIDVDSLRHHTNAPWLVITSGGRDKGLFLRNDKGTPQVWDSRSETLASHDDPNVFPRLSFEYEHDNGQHATSVFNLVVKEYLKECYLPENIASITGINSATIKGLATEIARVAFNESSELPISWTDYRGIHHRSTIARPVAIHAMRGISAHSNGFQTCRALHILQMLIGAVDAPGGTRFKPPYPKPVEAHPIPSKAQGPGQPLKGHPLGYPLGPEHLLIDSDGKPERIDKAYSWEAPLAAHGMMHMAIPNAAAGDPYEIDVMFIYMSNMAWNSSMNPKAAMEALNSCKDDGSYRIPKLIVSDTFASEMVSFADLVLPDTTYFERHDCISLLDRPIGEPDLLADAIRYPVIKPAHNVRPFQDVLIELGARLKLPGFVDSKGEAKWTSYSHYMVMHERYKDIGPLAGWRGSDGTLNGLGPANPHQLERYIENGGFWSTEIPNEAQYYKHVNQDYQDWAVSMGVLPKAMPFKLQIYSEPLRKFQLAAEGFGPRQPPANLKDRIHKNFSPLPVWNSNDSGSTDYPIHAITQRPMAMYHSWGSHNPWLRQLHSKNSLYVPGVVCDRDGLVDGDWVWLESDISRIRVQIQRMDAVNSSTVWTWNAIGKRSGAWRLTQDAPESKTGFLMNHLIADLLPTQPDGSRWSNSDPVTGQAAWYDLKVRIYKADSEEEWTEPQFSAQSDPPNLTEVPVILTYGSEWTK